MKEAIMRITSSYSTNTTNPYQEDKDKLLNTMDSIKKRQIKKILQEQKAKQTESLMDTKGTRNNRLSKVQSELKENISDLSRNAIDKHDQSGVKESIAKIQSDIKSNKNLILKTHDTAQIQFNLRSQFLLSVYAQTDKRVQCTKKYTLLHLIVEWAGF